MAAGAHRNRTRPAGLYFGDVGDSVFDAVVPHIVPPSAEEIGAVGLVLVRERVEER